jgi:hypothetical protein
VLKSASVENRQSVQNLRGLINVVIGNRFDVIGATNSANSTENEAHWRQNVEQQSMGKTSLWNENNLNTYLHNTTG